MSIPPPDLRRFWRFDQLLTVTKGNTHLAIALGLAACRPGRRVRFFTATLVNQLEEAQKQYRLERLLVNLDLVGLLICGERGYPRSAPAAPSCCSGVRRPLRGGAFSRSASGEASSRAGTSRSNQSALPGHPGYEKIRNSGPTCISPT